MIREQAERHKASFPVAAHLIDKNTFMDDFAAGAEEKNGAITIYYEITAIMSLINPRLAKWATNAKLLKTILKAEGGTYAGPGRKLEH
jgi:hypothetical protein